MEPVLRKYKLTGRNVSLNHNGEIRKEGDVVELSDMQAQEFKSILTPVDAEAEAVIAGPVDTTIPQGLRDHELEELLTSRELQLAAELEKTRTALNEVRQKREAKEREKPPAPQPETPSQV